MYVKWKYVKAAETPIAGLLSSTVKHDKNSPSLWEGHQGVRESGTNILEKLKRKSGRCQIRLWLRHCPQLNYPCRVFWEFMLTSNNRTQTEKWLTQARVVCLSENDLKSLLWPIFTDMLDSWRPVDSNGFCMYFVVFYIPSTRRRYETVLFIEDAYI